MHFVLESNTSLGKFDTTWIAITLATTAEAQGTINVGYSGGL
jgi:hypothetical protein